MDFREVIFLPLYSYKDGRKHVFEKSGLNQWNAEGRKRNLNEAYIPIPTDIYTYFNDFFPKRSEAFLLVTATSRKKMSAKACQEGAKGLMTNPNSDLGEWILRDVLNIPIGELVTYEMLNEIGIDSVCIQKTIKDDKSCFYMIKEVPVLNMYEKQMKDIIL